MSNAGRVSGDRRKKVIRQERGTVVESLRESAAGGKYFVEQRATTAQVEVEVGYLELGMHN
jgi:hypothetical protein